MSTAELKLDLINRIANLNESYIIEDVKRLLDFELDENVYCLNDAQKIRLTEAKCDDILTAEEANRQIEEWLREK
ncbi:MAG: hypothetical protein ACK5IJ_01640 [Mangrovibacterium sp.]